MTFDFGTAAKRQQEEVQGHFRRFLAECKAQHPELSAPMFSYRCPFCAEPRMVIGFGGSEHYALAHEGDACPEYARMGAVEYMEAARLRMSS